jgi:DNA repair protein RecO (recombination protein O)
VPTSRTTRSRYRAPLEDVSALVLRTVEFGEADLIVHLLTPTRGRVTAMAKHARKSVRRFPGSLDLFNHLAVKLHPRRRGGMPLLDRARLVTAFLPLRRDAVRYGLACYLTEVLTRLAPEEGAGAEMEGIFAFALEALHALETMHPDARARVLLELRMLDALGMRPELRHCVRCGREVEGPRVRFHVADGGVVCRACAAHEELPLQAHLGTLRALEQGLRFPLDGLARLALAGSALSEAQQIVGRFQRYHVGLELRSERFLNQVLRAPAGPTRAA